MDRAEGAREILDGPVPLAELRESLGDVARLNALFGGRGITIAQVKRLVGAFPPGRPLTVLDIGSGIGDIPRALVRWGRRIGRSVRVLALDLDLTALQIARAASRGYPEITYLQADALALPVPEAGVDVVISALTL